MEKRAAIKNGNNDGLGLGLGFRGGQRKGGDVGPVRDITPSILPYVHIHTGAVAIDLHSASLVNLFILDLSALLNIHQSLIIPPFITYNLDSFRF